MSATSAEGYQGEVRKLRTLAARCIEDDRRQMLLGMADLCEYFAKLIETMQADTRSTQP